MRKPLSLLLALTLIAAAPPSAADGTDAVVSALLQQDQAVAAVGYRLVTANADLCPDRMVESGITIGTLAQYDAAYRPAAATVLGMTDRPTVELVVPGSPAERAGLKPGDVLVSADAALFATAQPQSEQGKFVAVEAAMRTLDTALADGKAALAIDRKGQRMAIDLPGVPACRARFQIAGEGLDAFATTSAWIKLPPRMVEFAGAPDQLAAVMAHELAHKALRHGLAKGGALRAQELQADRLVPYLLARASYDPGAAVTLWLRFKAKRLGGLFPGSYPGWSDRIAAIEGERARIATIMARGDTIIPPDDLRAR